MSLASRSYTDDSTHVASASTRCDTQGPRETNASAAATCRASSLVSRRTSTFVSTARTAFPDVPPHALLHLLERPWRGCCGKKRPMDLRRCVAAGAPHDDRLAVSVPF